jgi:hypothetical protein
LCAMSSGEYGIGFPFANENASTNGAGTRDGSRDASAQQRRWRRRAAGNTSPYTRRGSKRTGL